MSTVTSIPLEHVKEVANGDPYLQAVVVILQKRGIAIEEIFQIILEIAEESQKVALQQIANLKGDVHGLFAVSRK